MEYVTEKVCPGAYDRLGLKEVMLHPRNLWVQAPNVINHSWQVFKNKFTPRLWIAFIKRHKVVAAGSADVDQNRGVGGRI